ncbi:MAG: efflux RND transporter permease subunit [Acidobacteria bacterium]|nr:efflux RND transporter permease subunit [Acidobacteriota bacterium]MBI3278936.1 efflux RND transporter permease subunit [Acidobacteriota bacterium]
MWLVNIALRRPITIMVAVLAVALASMLAIKRMKVDIFPSLGSPTIYVAQPYGGMDPSQMEGFLTYYYEYHFLYVTGIEHVESKSIQGVALMKLVFHPETNMNQAIAEVVAMINRARAFMPPGAVPPFLVRFDAGTVPVGQLVFSSAIRSPGEMQDFALNRVRPLFATLPGVSAPPPFGGNQRTILVRVDPERLRAYQVSPEEVIGAVNRASAVLPSGNVRMGDEIYIASTNAVIGGNLQDLMNAPLRTGSGPAVYIRDIGVVESGTDIITGYAHVNGRRTVYIPVTKRSDASTLDVMRRVKAALPKMKAAVPEDVDVRIEFDQSGYVTGALRSLVNEALLGAVLTGLMVLLFLRDWRSALIVVATIPFALLAAVVWLWAAGQTINMMTLAGLALAVGVLVDEATVLMESLHAHLAGGLSRPWSVLQATAKTAIPRLLAMLSILAVFLPSYFMTGVGRQLFIPLSLAVGFAMVSSYLLSNTLVPVLSIWLVRRPHGETERGFFHALRSAYSSYLTAVMRWRWPLAGAYVAGSLALIWLLFPRIGTEIFPQADTGQFQLRLRAPAGTRIERTEVLTLQALDVIRGTVGPENVQITTSFIGVQPASYPINTIYLWTSGPHESVLLVALKPATKLRGEELKEVLRARLAKALPDVRFSFEAGDIISRVMSFGSPTTVEVGVQGPSLPANRAFAGKVYTELAKLPVLRDLQYAQPLDYPSLEIEVDRDRAGQYGLTAANVARSLVAATSSSRFIEPNYWRDPASGNAFQIQVEIPQYRMSSVEDVRSIPVMPASLKGAALLGDVAQLKLGKSLGLVERYNMQRVVSITANLHGETLGEAAGDIRRALARAGEPPRGVTVAVRGQIPPLEETLDGLEIGLLLSIVAIFLLLAANFQSFRLALAVISTIPAVLCGVLLALLATGTTLNVQSFMGAIMAIGIAVANSILLVTFAERSREAGAAVNEAGIEGGRGRLRAILMTATAMIAGMLPIALGAGEAGEQTAPLGRAVIGGLALATLATLTALPAVYAIVQRRASSVSASLHPQDSTGRYYEPS